VARLEKRRFLYNHSGDFPQVILIIPSHVPNTNKDWVYFSLFMFAYLHEGIRKNQIGTALKEVKKDWNNCRN
jgi:hypothetical protein